MTATRALVTGADGFIGSHLLERLLEDGFDVRAFCAYNSNGSLGWLDGLDPDRRDALDVRLGDVRDARFVRMAVEGVDVVFHLAALIAIPFSYQAPGSFVETNVTGTLNVLEALRDTGAARLVNTSTSEVYGTPETVPITEGHPLKGQSPYSATKIAADKLCEAYALSFGTPVVTLRPFNTFGPRQSARAVIPTILGQLLSGVQEIRLGSLHPRRDFTYVGDTVDGFVRMGAADLAPGATVHLGTGTAASIGEVFELCREITGTGARVVTEDERLRPERSEVAVLLSDPSRARRLLGWEPGVELREGLEHTANWLRDRVDARAAVRFQL
ncbi:MAG: SDR family NAD(P)-dependent oxidoreductase [Actinomycetota bacterium]|nr:SDR family NAD(P)-dependent oxidoreductase [Actinomycetota bacterium]